MAKTPAPAVEKEPVIVKETDPKKILVDCEREGVGKIRCTLHEFETLRRDQGYVKTNVQQPG